MNKKLFIKSIVGGALIALGCYTALLAAQTASILYAVVFPVGLVMLVLCGSALFTGAFTAVSDVIARKLPLKQFLINLGICYGGNLLGVALVVLSVLTFISPELSATINGLAEKKEQMALLPLVIKAILCNILVCLAVLLYRQHKQLILLYIPIFVFVLCGFEHSIADMFIFGVGFKWEYVLPLIIITLGNAIGGLLISIIYQYFNNNRGKLNHT